MKQKSIYFLFFLSILFFCAGCSENNDEIGTDEKAPSSPSGKEFVFYPTPDRWSFRVLVGKSPDQTAIRVNSDSWSVRKPFSYYSKTSENSATLSVNFNAYTTLGTGTVGQYHEYELKLTFTSEHQGTYIGVHKQGAIGNLQSENISGYFVFDSDELPNTNDDGEKNIDFAHLIGTWKTSYGDIVKKVIFESDKTFVVELSGESNKMRGTYSYDTSKTLINLTWSGGKTSDSYKVKFLTTDKMEWSILKPDGTSGNPEIFTKDNSTSEPEGNVAISDPIISNITSNSATIKGTILGDGVVFEERGICYSTNATPTINDKHQRSNVDVINQNISELYTGTVYNVCLYAKVNGKVQYGKILSFKTDGEQVSSIILNATKIASNNIILNAKLPNDVTSFGLCYGTTPHPVVTDFSVPEKSRTEEWTLTRLKSGTNYYIRPYHKDGTKIIYYDTETSVKTTGGTDFSVDITQVGNIKSYDELDPVVHIYLKGWYRSLKIAYNIDIEGTYSVALHSNNGRVSFYNLGFIKNGSGELSARGKEFAGASTYYSLEFRCVETGILYECGSFGTEETPFL